MGPGKQQDTGAAVLSSLLASPVLPGYSPSLHIRWTVPLLLQWEGSKFTRNLGSNLATSPWSTLGMLCRSSSSNLRFRVHTTGALEVAAMVSTLG